MFYQGLKHEIREKMMTPLPTSYREMTTEAIKIGERLYELEQEKKGNRGFFGGSSYRTAGRRRDYGDPMDLSAM